jgi:hypothetical protein
MSFIIFDHEPTKPMEALIPNSNDTVASPDFGRFAFQTPWAGGGTDVADSDTHCVVQNRWGARWLWGGGGLGRGPIPTGILFQLSQCVPALPLWYQYGFIGPCGLLRMAGLSDGTGRVLAKATWVSDSETNAILSAVKKTKALPKIPPIEDLFIPNGPAGVKSITAWPSPVWMAEAALFLRWGLFGEPDKAESHLQQFALFIERSRVEPVNEPLFRQCFGFGYAEMQSRLSEFLVDAARQPIVISNLVFKHWVPHPDPNYPVLPNLDLTFRTFETRYRATLSL